MLHVFVHTLLRTNTDLLHQRNSKLLSSAPVLFQHHDKWDSKKRSWSDCHFFSFFSAVENYTYCLTVSLRVFHSVSVPVVRWDVQPPVWVPRLPNPTAAQRNALWHHHWLLRQGQGQHCFRLQHVALLLTTPSWSNVMIWKVLINYNKILSLWRKYRTVKLCFGKLT